MYLYIFRRDDDDEMMIKVVVFELLWEFFAR